MGNTQSTVRYLAPASFLFDFAAQQYGMFFRPNMLDIHNKNLGAFSPYPYAVAGFLLPTTAVPARLAVEAVEARRNVCR
jgi:hypothetical protein